MTAPTVRLVLHVDHDLADDLVTATAGLIRWRTANGEVYSPLLVDLGRRAIEIRARCLTASQSEPRTDHRADDDSSVVVSAGPGVVTVAQAAESAGISRASLYRLWNQGGGPRSLRIGHRRFITIEALEDWLAA